MSRTVTRQGPVAGVRMQPASRSLPQALRPGAAARRSRAGYGSRLATAAQLMIASAFMLLAVTAPAAAALAFIGTMPTVAAWIAETNERRGLTFCVGALNLAGVALAVMFFILDTSPSLALSRYLASPIVWAGMYGTAAIGWGLFMSIPPLIQSAEVYRRRKRLSELRRFRRALIEEWGEEVAADSPATDLADEQ